MNIIILIQFGKASIKGELILIIPCKNIQLARGERLENK
jgi:hypothetical protein